MRQIIVKRGARYVKIAFANIYDKIRHNNFMKTNGIVRKVDGLGRVVIPREFRKLHKISLGDPMEISCMDNGEIVLRKLDMTLTLEELSSEAVRSLSEAVSGTVLVSNTEKWIGGSGKYKNQFAGKELPEQLRKMITERKGFCCNDCRELLPWQPTDEKYPLAGEPIAGDGDVFGALFVCSDKVTVGVNELLRVAANILGNSLQKF